MFWKIIDNTTANLSMNNSWLWLSVINFFVMPRAHGNQYNGKANKFVDTLSSISEKTKEAYPPKKNCEISDICQNSVTLPTL